MVLLKVKARPRSALLDGFSVGQISEEDQFLYRTTLDVSVEATRSALVEIFNLRQKLRRLNIHCEELADYGPSAPPNAQGIVPDTEAPSENEDGHETDLSGKRTGNGCPEAAKATLKRTLSNAMALVHKANPSA